MFQVANQKKETKTGMIRRVLNAYKKYNEKTRYQRIILQEVKDLISEKERNHIRIQKVNKGHSTARNYCVFVGDQPVFFVKVFRNIGNLSLQLQELSRKDNRFMYPISDFYIGTKRCMVTNWIKGSELTGTQAEAYQIAEILKVLHSHGFSSHSPLDGVNNELRKYRLYLAFHHVKMIHSEEILSYLLKNINQCNSNCSLTHMDVHLQNFITDSNGVIHLVDYENMCVTDPWRDFVYACFFHDKNEDDFWWTVLTQYFDSNIPDYFWVKMKFYCYLHLLRMIICEHQNMRYEKLDQIVHSIWTNWNCDHDDLPRWLRSRMKE